MTIPVKQALARALALLVPTTLGSMVSVYAAAAWTPSGNDIVVNPPGSKVGIGIATTATPEANLQIAASSPWLMIDRTGTGTEAGIDFRTGGTHHFWIWQDNLGTTNDLRIASSGLTGEDDSHPRMIFRAGDKNILANQSGGLFGIGQTTGNNNLTPDYQLHVSAPNYKALKLETWNQDSHVTLSGKPTNSGYFTFNVNGGKNGFIFGKGNPDAPPGIGIGDKELMRIESDGRVGFGAVATDATVNVYAPQPWIQLERTDISKEAGIMFKTGTKRFWMWQDNSADGINSNDGLRFAASDLVNEDDSHPRLLMPGDNRNILACQSGGYMGIGQGLNKSNLNPTYQLHVATADYKALKLSTTNQSSDILFTAEPSTGGNLKINTNGGLNGIVFTKGNPDPTGGVELARIDADGNFTAKGEINAASIKTKTWTIAPDYVFEKEYKLATLDHVEKFVKENKHLPNVPSAKEFKKDGMDLAEMNFTLLRKVEELTLYVIELKKEVNTLKAEKRTNHRNIQ